MALSKITNSGIGAIDTLAVDTDTLVVDSTNNRVGIGTSSPLRTLDIQADSGTNIPLIVRGGSSQTNAFITIRDANTTGDFYNRIGSVGDNLVLYTNQTERMRIESGGDVKIGTHYEFRSNGDFVIPASGFSSGTDSKQMAAAILYSSRSTTSTAGHLSFHNANGEVGSVTTSGSSTAYNTASDYRLKENVVADWDATTRLKQLNPVRFNFIADPDTTVDGFLAHEVQSVVPEAISGTHNEVDDEGNPVYQGIDQSKLVPLLVKTIQELEARIAALENA